MKKFFLILIVLFASPALYAGPRISIDQSGYNFGIVKSGAVIEGGFSVSNAGDAALNVTAVPEEGCLITNESSFSLQKNGSRTVGFQIRTKKDYDGYFSKSISVRSNDKDFPEIILTVNGIVNNPAAGPHRVFERKINYLTNLDLSTLESDNIATIINYKHCESCIAFVNLALERLVNRERDVIINYYNLEINENKESLSRFIKKTGYFPDLPIIVYKGKNYFGKTEVKNFAGGSGTEGPGKKLPAREISIAAVFSAGLLDGINPCAFTVIILLISYLTLQLRSARSILLSGLIYIFSVFITYFLIGLGLFQFIKVLQIFPIVSAVIKYLLVIVLFILAALSLFDFIKARQGKNNEMVLKLPDFLQKAVRRNIRMQMKDYSILFSSLILGFLVSVFELLCTGQVYLPVIGYMAQNESERFSGLAYLLLYNTAFILPLVLIFVLVYFGVSSKKIGEALAKNVPAIKLAFAVLFVIFGVITAVTILL